MSRFFGPDDGQALKEPHTPLQTLFGAAQMQSMGGKGGEGNGTKPFLQLNPQGLL